MLLLVLLLGLLLYFKLYIPTLFLTGGFRYQKTSAMRFNHVRIKKGDFQALVEAKLKRYSISKTYSTVDLKQAFFKFFHFPFTARYVFYADWGLYNVHKLR